MHAEPRLPSDGGCVVSSPLHYWREAMALAEFDVLLGSAHHS